MSIDKEKLKGLAEAACASDATLVEKWYLYEHLKPEAVIILLSEFDNLKAENEALRRDAERYRWLRKRDLPIDGHDFLSAQEILDDRIDAKLAAGIP